MGITGEAELQGLPDWAALCNASVAEALLGVWPVVGCRFGLSVTGIAGSWVAEFFRQEWIGGPLGAVSLPQSNSLKLLIRLACHQVSVKCKRVPHSGCAATS